MKFAGIVFYNELIENSNLIEMLDTNKYAIIIYDNSTDSIIQNENQKYCKTNHLTYLFEGKNLGVSHAYLKIIENATRISTDKSKDWITMFDDDSVPEKSYFLAVNESIKTNQNSKTILLPIVLADNEIVLSPSIIGGIKGYKIFRTKKEALSYKGKKITGINTGMVINMTVFENASYNPKLFIDHIDHDFLNKAKNTGVKIMVIDGKIHHDLSEYNLSSIESAKFRFSKYINDSKEYYNRGEYYYHIIRRIIKYTVFFRSLDFIKIFISNN